MKYQVNIIKLINKLHKEYEITFTITKRTFGDWFSADIAYNPVGRYTVVGCCTHWWYKSSGKEVRSYDTTDMLHDIWNKKHYGSEND